MQCSSVRRAYIYTRRRVGAKAKDKTTRGVVGKTTFNIQEGQHIQNTGATDAHTSLSVQ